MFLTLGRIMFREPTGISVSQAFISGSWDMGNMKAIHTKDWSDIIGTDKIDCRDFSGDEWVVDPIPESCDVDTAWTCLSGDHIVWFPYGERPYECAEDGGTDFLPLHCVRLSFER